MKTKVFLFILLFNSFVLISEDYLFLSNATFSSVIDSITKSIENNKNKDCNSNSTLFFARIFAEYNIIIPHSSIGLKEICKKVEPKDVKKGDFVFKSKNVGYIIYSTKDSIISLFCNKKRLVTKSFEKRKKSDIFFGRLPFSKSKQIETKKDTITVIGVGDIMLGTNYPSEKYLPKNPRFLLSSVKNILKNADLTFGNLEGTILSGEGEIKHCKNTKTCYAFKTPDYYVTYLKDAGFNLLSVANNHSLDFGNIGKFNTIKLLKNNKIHFAGYIDYPYTIFKKDNIKFGFCAFSPNKGTVSIHNIYNAKRIVSKLDSICDIVIVSFHGGGEGEKFRHIKKKTEYYLGENRGNPYKFARAVIDAGADIVFGHGPHITRAVDLYKNRFIAYSLGNFATYGRFNLQKLKGIAPIIKIFVNNKGEFLYGKIYPIKQIGRGKPILDKNKTAIKEIQKLTKTDFPRSQLIIKNDGTIIKVKN